MELIAQGINVFTGDIISLQSLWVRSLTPAKVWKWYVNK